MKAKVIGLPRSGTNYLRWLIDRNFDAKTHKDIAWEHAFPHDRWERYGQRMEQTVLEATAGLTRILIFKDRERWLDSVGRHRQGHGQIIDYLGRYPEKVYDDFLAAWAPHAAFVRYESFIQDFAATLDYLGTLLSCPPRSYCEPVRVAESPDWMLANRGQYLDAY